MCAISGRWTRSRLKPLLHFEVQQYTTIVTTTIRYLLCSLLLLAGGARADPAEGRYNGFPRPLPVNNQSPVVGVFGIPRAQGTDILGPGNTHWAATLDLASHFQASAQGNEIVVFDGETARFAIQARYGITEKWNVGVEVPWIHHGPGFLDHLIIEWHDVWGFPQRGRDEVPEDQLLFRYDRGGATRFEVDAATGGIGDVVVSSQRSLWRGAGSAGVWHAQLKLPTGDADKLTGSGAVDAATGIELAGRWRPGWHSTLRAGAAYLGEGDVLPAMQRSWAAYGGLDLVWRPIRALALRVQYDARTAPYHDSGLGELTRWSGLLTTGATWHLTRGTVLDLAVIENVPNSRVVSDVTFQLRLRTATGGGR